MENETGLTKPIQKVCALLMAVTLVSQLCYGQVNTGNLVSTIRDSLSRYYIFPEKTSAITGYLKSREDIHAYRSIANDPLKLVAQLQKDFKTIYHDPHLRINYDPSFVQQHQSAGDTEETARIKKYWKENNYAFKKVEVLAGNIGYLRFDLFVDDQASAKQTVSAAMKFLVNTQAMIVDLRENMGGNPEMVSLVESYFFKERMHMNDLINRSKGDTSFLYADPAKVDGLYMGMPVYMLTSQSTFSGAEDFSYAMQKAGRAIVVGEKTGGGAHPQMPFSVGQGFVLSIPFARSINPVTKTDWEGTGVVPDVSIKAAGALPKALELAFTRAKAIATNQTDQNKYNYYLRSLLRPSALSATQLTAFTGTYGDFEIYLKHNQLYCKNNNNNSTTILQPLTRDLFILDAQAQLGFIKNLHGKYTSIKIYVNNGSVFEEKRKNK